MDSNVFKAQFFNFNLVNVIIVFGFIVLSILFFKEEDQSIITQNESTLPNLKLLFTNPQSLKIILAVCIPNGLLVVLGSIINIIVVDQGFDSLLASIVILLTTLCGLIASIIYTIIFFKVKNHSINFMIMMGLTALTLGVSSFGLYIKNKWLFSVMLVLAGSFAFPIIPFLMEKNSLDFPNVSFNIINLGKFIYFYNF